MKTTPPKILGWTCFIGLLVSWLFIVPSCVRAEDKGAGGLFTIIAMGALAICASIGLAAAYIAKALRREEPLEQPRNQGSKEGSKVASKLIQAAFTDKPKPGESPAEWSRRIQEESGKA